VSPAGAGPVVCVALVTAEARDRHCSLIDLRYLIDPAVTPWMM
jgi:hypothetical protein